MATPSVMPVAARRVILRITNIDWPRDLIDADRQVGYSLGARQLVCANFAVGHMRRQSEDGQEIGHVLSLILV